jgi:hypothetical protein
MGEVSQITENPSQLGGIFDCRYLNSGSKKTLITVFPILSLNDEIVIAPLGTANFCSK